MLQDAPTISVTDEPNPTSTGTAPRCVVCQVPYAPKPSIRYRQRTCGALPCRRKHANRHRRSDLHEVPCAVCGATFMPSQRKCVTCRRPECQATVKDLRWWRWALGEGVAERKGVLRSTVAAKLTELLAHCHRPDAFGVVLPVESPPPPARLSPNDVDPWGLTPPLTFTHLPLVVAPLHLAPARVLDLSEANALHGALSRAVGARHRDRPQWVLSFAGRSVSPSGVLVGLPSKTDLDALRGPWPVRLGAQVYQATLGHGWSSTVKAPPVPPPGRYRVRLDTLTPVVVKRSVRVGEERTNVHRQHVTAGTLTSTLASTLAPRLGWRPRVEDVPVMVVSSRTEPTRDVLRGRGDHITMHAAGWEGHVVLETNAVGLWLLECAARGVGLGGRVAFGYGQVRLRRLPLEGAAEPVVVPVPSSATPTVTDYAVLRYAQLVLGRRSLPSDPAAQEALREEVRCVARLGQPHARTSRPRGMDVPPADEWWEWRGPRVGSATGPHVRLVVGRTKDHLVVASVLPPRGTTSPTAKEARASLVGG